DLNSNEVIENTLSMTATTSIESFESVVDIDEDPEEDACSYIETTWPLVEQAMKRIHDKRSANNWCHLRSMIEWCRLALMEEEIQSVEQKRHRQATWVPAFTKPYLMYLPCSDKSTTINDTMDLLVFDDIYHEELPDQLLLLLHLIDANICLVYKKGTENSCFELLRGTYNGYGGEKD
ncbi:659_t:CDS:2, partial [Cetraspora pellucida]